ncbi:MAG TPA: GNAT family N-acetyltransferase [Ilumatobacteraceae bacterium]
MIVSTDVELRPATPSDEEFEFGVFAAGWQLSLRELGWPDDVIDAFVRQQFDVRRPQHLAGGAVTQIIRHGGNDVGVVTVRRDEAEIRLVDIAVVPAARGQGLATCVIEALLADADHGGFPVWLHVAADNPARHLYERLNFEAVTTDDELAGGAPYIEMVRVPGAEGAR